MLKTRRAWVVLCAVVCVLVVALGWIAVISPRLSEADQIRDEASQSESANRALQIKVTKLAQQYAHLDDDRAKVAAAQAYVPASGDRQAGLDQLYRAAHAASLAVAKVTVGNGSVVTLPTTAANGAQSTSSSKPSSDTAVRSSSDTESSDDAAEDAPVLVATPVTMDVVGDYEATVAFLADVQSDHGRYVQVSALDVTAVEASDGGAGSPPTSDGDLETTVTMTFYSYTLKSSAAAEDAGGGSDGTATGAASSSKDSLPSGHSGREVFAPETR